MPLNRPLNGNALSCPTFSSVYRASFIYPRNSREKVASRFAFPQSSRLLAALPYQRRDRLGSRVRDLHFRQGCDDGVRELGDTTPHEGLAEARFFRQLLEILC